MSRDCSGILYYGFPIEIPDNEEENYDERESVYDKFHVLNEQWIKQYGPLEPSNKNYKSPEWDEWRSKQGEFNQSPQSIVIDWIGSDEFKKFYVHCYALEKEVCCGQQLDLGLEPLVANTFQMEAKLWISKFCEQFGITYKISTWHLACC